MAAILGGIAIVLGVVCAVLVVRTQEFLSDSSSASGEVIGLVSRQSCDEDEDGSNRSCTTVYAPRVRFTTGDGRQVVFVSGTASSPPSHREGDRVDVRYRSANPMDARIDSFIDIWIGGLVTGGLALFFAALGGVWVVLAIRFRRE